MANQQLINVAGKVAESKNIYKGVGENISKGIQEGIDFVSKSIKKRDDDRKKADAKVATYLDKMPDGKPIIEGNQTVCAGNNATFSVIASGSNLTYQWRKGTVNIAGETNATLTLNSVTALDVATNYNVVVSGTCAPTDTSDFVTLVMN